jgi:NADH:ubiquinone oxidoreductase subunit E
MATTTITQDQLRADVEVLVEKLGPGRSSLIPILADVKRRFHAVDTESMQTIADVLDIHPVEVYAVATFYASPALCGPGCCPHTLPSRRSRPRRAQ